MRRVLPWIAAAVATLVLSGCAAALMGRAASGGHSSGQPSASQGSGGNRTSAQAAEDRRIASTVRSRLLADPVAKTLAVSVDTYQGVVTLRGNVKTAEQRSAAERVARSVQGVRGVRNEMRVR